MLRRLLPVSCPLRKKNLRVRMSRKRERTKDRFAPSHTKEPPLHPWFNSHRARALLQEYQRVRNLNRFTIVFNEELRKEYAEKAQEYSLFKLHQFYGSYQRLCDITRGIDEAAKEGRTLPKYLQNELFTESRVNDKYDRPSAITPYNKYMEQMIKIYPPILSANLLAARRLKDIASDSIKFHES